jgi:hypothetical protein
VHQAAHRYQKKLRRLTCVSDRCQSAPADPECANGERLTGQQCVLKFARCEALPTGDFCGT